MRNTGLSIKKNMPKNRKILVKNDLFIGIFRTDIRLTEKEEGFLWWGKYFLEKEEGFLLKEEWCSLRGRSENIRVFAENRKRGE